MPSHSDCQIHVFICRGCGKRSYAKRDPIAHERREYSDTDYGRRCEFVWCGPFDRYIAELDTSKPQRDASAMRHLGTNSRPAQEYENDDDLKMAEVPF